jgi:1-acyl-sn-glycerol-3-phosphate acyltransferase
VTSRLRLLALACLRAAVVAAAAIALAELPAAAGLDPDAVRRTVLLTGVGAAVGCAVAGFQIHPRRSLGLIPFASTGLAVVLLIAALSEGRWSPAFSLIVGLFAGVAGPAVRALVQAAVLRRLAAMPLDAAAAVLMLLPIVLIENGALAPAGAWGGVLAAVCGVAAVAAWALLLTPTLELLTEFVFWPMYDIRAHGPGADRVPRRGPLLLLANHSSYTDPFWICKVVPRHIAPMMTSDFYDFPGIHFLMVHQVKAIRVQAATFRREAPELAEAVERLRRGGCVLLFPEGTLRKREDRPLLPFGQGVWHILKELPRTPIVVCWIEGGWGSFTSYKGGPPLTNKRLDFRRPIDIFVSEPRFADAAVLADHRATRAWLRRAVLECRRALGLPTPEEPADEAEADARQIKP